MRVAVILPSRGLIFSQTADEILQNVKGIPHRFYFAHRLPIPACFEEPTLRALQDDDITHLWFVEDDMVLPDDTLLRMLKLDVAAVTANYPTTKRGDASVLTIKGRVVYGGTGCLLVKRAVFDELKPPYFRSDIAWIPKNKGDYFKFTATKRKDIGYGFHDVNFYMSLFQRDIPVHKLDGDLAQRKLVALGKAGSNEGAHQIEVWRHVKKDRYYTLRKNLKPEPDTGMTTVLVNGKEITCTPAHARKLIAKGMGTKPPKRAVVIDATEAL